MQLIRKGPTNEENVRYTLQCHRTGCSPGRAQHHPVANDVGTQATRLCEQTGAEAPASAASITDDTNPSTKEFMVDEILSLCERVFYVPISDNQEALDVFLLLNDILYIFRFTVVDMSRAKFSAG